VVARSCVARTHSVHATQTCRAFVKETGKKADTFRMANTQLKTRPGYQYPADRHRPGPESHRGEIAAVVVERTDGTCTVLWAGIWRTFNSKPEEWASRGEAIKAVDTVVGDILIWNEMAPHTWAARAA
jgi:hypothetical protein